MKKIAFVILLAFLCSGCGGYSAKGKAGELLKADGVSIEHLSDWSWWDAKWHCHKDEAVAYTFSGLKNGVRVSGCVCSDTLGWSFTIRYF